MSEWDPIIVDHSVDGRVEKIGDRWVPGLNKVISEERLDRLFSGYECLNCNERLMEAFPEVCPLPGCGYRIREDQKRDLGEQFKGWDREFSEAMEPELESKERARNAGIWVP